MKILATVIMASLVSSIPAFAQGALDGATYCRTIISDGMFGQPAGERAHCVEFKDGVATDYANTFFGNPPESEPYTVQGQRVLFGDSIYEISGDGKSLTTIKGSAQPGIVLTLE